VPAFGDGCGLCKGGKHHPSEHWPRAEPKVGDVVFVRAIVTAVDVEDFHTDIHVKEYEPGYPGRNYYKASVNSVDIYPCQKVQA